MASDSNTSSQERTLATSQSESGVSAAFVRDRYQKAIKATRKEANDYWLNHAFLEGEQWLHWNTQTRRLEDVPRDPDRVQATVDKMGPSSRTVISKLISRPMGFEVPPTGADDATLQGAATSRAILDSIRVEHDWEALREQAMWSVWKGGTAALVIEWDASAGDPVGVSEETGREFGTGDTAESVLSIVEFGVEPGVRDGEKARWWVRSLALPPEHVQATYHLDKLPKADASAAMSPSQTKLLNSGTGGGTEQTDLTQVLTYFERPNPLAKSGRVLVVVGDEIVEERPWPFPWKDRLNLVILRESVVDGRWLGHTVVSKARSVQVALNASWSSIIEHMKLAGNARLMVPNSSIDMIDELSDLPGEMVPFPDGTEKPGYLTPPQMPSWWIEQPRMLGEQLDDILGVHEVSRGQMPSNIESGVGLSILTENDNTPTGRLIQDTARGFGRLATFVLELYEAKVKETRSSVVQTPGYPPETTQWTGADLVGQTRAIVPVDGIVPRSRAAMQALAQRMMDGGLLKSFAEFAEIADLPDQHSIIQAVEPDIAKARRENHELALGKTAVPAPFDDHAKHITQHNNFRKSPKYDLLSQELRDIVDLHVQAHETLAAEAAGHLDGRLNSGGVTYASAPMANGSPLPVMSAEAGAPNGSTGTPPDAGAPPVPEAPPAL